MNKDINNLNNKIIEVKKRLDNIKNIKISDKNKALLYIKLEEEIDSINEIIDNFEINNINQFRIDKEIEMRIYENRKMKDIINKFGPYILLYQMSLE